MTNGENAECEVTGYISFVQPINPATATKLLTVCSQMQERGITHIHLGISSSGGNLNSGFAIYNQLKDYSANFTTYNIGGTNSVALLVYLIGQRRVATPISSFLFHGTNWTFASNNEIPFSQISDALNTLANQEKALFDEISKVSGINRKTITRWRNSSRNLSAEEAVKFGYAQEIGPFAIPKTSNWAQIG